jgi:hypothetical protein
MMRLTVALPYLPLKFVDAEDLRSEELECWTTEMALRTWGERAYLMTSLVRDTLINRAVGPSRCVPSPCTDSVTLAPRGFRAPELENFRASGLQNFRASEHQSFRASELQSFRAPELQNFRA